MRAQDGTSAVQPARLGGRRAASCRSRILAVVLTALAGTALLASGARAASYPYATVTGTGSDTFTTPNALTFTNPADGTANSDDGTAALTLPFAFTIFGHSYAAGTTLHVSTNGVLEFADNQRSWTNTALPTSTFTGPAILPYWTDFDLTVTHDVIPSGGGEGAAWGVNNSAPNRVLVVRWWGYRHGTLPESRIGLEVALAEGTNRIDTLYTRALTDPMANGSTATIGIQEGGPTGQFVQFSQNTASIPGTGFYVEYLPQVPTRTAWPEITGTTQVGQMLSVSTGSWDGTPDSFSYTWERCSDSDCVGYSNIAGATGSTYTLTSADAGHKVFAAVSATNGWGTSGWAFAYPVGPVSAVPLNTAAPHVTGSAQVGATLTSTAGTWSGADGSYEYEWLRCNASCTILSGQTGSTYVVTLADVGHSLATAVRAHNSAGWSAYTGSSNMVGPIPSPPTNSVRPHVAGTAQVPATLTTTAGTWSGSPDSYGYQWWRCVPSGGGGCTPGLISGQTASTYVLTSVDVGATIYPAVRAHSADGWSAYVVADNSIGPITAAVQPPVQVPANTTAPHVSGSVTVGATLTVAAGDWSGAPDLYAYEWWHCLPAAGGGCMPSAIAGATGTTYVLGAGDVGGMVYARVSAHNAGGWSAAATADNSIGPVVAAGAGGTGGATGGGNAEGGGSSTTAGPQVTSTGAVLTSRSGTAVTVRPGVVVACTAGGPSCTAVTSAQTRVTTHRGRRTVRTWVTIGRATTRIRAGSRAAVTFKLTSRGAALLRSRGRLSVKVTTKANLPGATAVQVVKTITIRQPKPARRSVTTVS